MMQEQRAELEQALKEIETWEQEQRDLSILEKIGRMPFTLLDRFTPKGLQQKIAELLDELGSYLHTGGNYLVQEKSVLKKLHANWQEADPATAGQYAEPDIALVEAMPLAVCDRVAEQVREANKTMAFAQGATTGFGGIFTLAIDIPAVLGLGLKVLQETAICYGYHPNDVRERVFIVKCMQLATSDVVGKRAILKDLADYDNPDRARDAISEVQGWRETMASFTDSFGWKKLFQSIPVLGMVLGSFMNRSMIHDMAETAQNMYRKRAVKARLRELDSGL
ncbi:EcsC family protein [Paenibacillus sp. MER TA 81-3]|uniref:EcsC family protein n=1 Tax=Paenibacillus sp. MER TA 81-3 TaxID=2939573 RepID=UPI00203D827B|nr:EcsC family protein [Paenibacillus sp. MER TA 81-3]MCM3342790.1 EcsC family protein [Paenibacillus sp. MER TA 81-3]